MSDQNFATRKQQISDICVSSIKSVLDGQTYNGELVKDWCEKIVRSILNSLSGDEFSGFKYLANALVLSKKSNGVHTVTMALWDPTNDGSETTQWNNESMQCVVTVWGMKYN